MAKMTIEIPDADYKAVKIKAIELGMTIKDYVRDLITPKDRERVLTGEELANMINSIVPVKSKGKSSLEILRRSRRD